MKMIKLFSLLLISLSFAACATHPKLDEVFEQELLFPKGEYKHKAKFEVISEEENETARPEIKKGTVTIEDQEINLYGMSSFGSAVFRVRENIQTGDLTTEIYDEKLKSQRARIDEYYAAVRNAMVLPKNGEWEGHTKVLAREATGRLRKIDLLKTRVPTKVEYDRFDETDVPKWIRVSNKILVITIEIQ